MTVRPLRPEEWPAYRAMRLRALLDAPEAFGATFAGESVMTDADWRSRTDRSDSATFVAEAGGALVGIAVGAPAPGYPDVAALFGMWVAPEARSQGLGTALIDAVKAWALAAGYPALGLGVTTTNALAIALYARLGFVDNGDRFPLRDGTDLVVQVMVTPLA